jgi:hypothetical protein
MALLAGGGRGRVPPPQRALVGALGVFAGDLVGALERGDEPDEERRLALEDLLVAAQRCAEMSPEELWTRCEGIVQGLDDRRQELPAGFPKQAHTRILFILTRCTRLLQFRKELTADEAGGERERGGPRARRMEGSRAGANHAGRGEGGGRPSTQIGGGRQARPPPSSSSSAAGRELVRALEAGEPEAGAPDASRTRRGPARIRPERAPPPREASSAGLH